MRKMISTAAIAAALALSATACHGGGSGSGSTHSAMASVAANPSVRADEQAAARLVQSCVTVAHAADLRGCIEGKVPPAARTALKACLATAASAVIGKKGAKALFEQGAQACVATALAPPVPGASARIPGYLPTASATR